MRTRFVTCAGCLLLLCFAAIAQEAPPSAVAQLQELASRGLIEGFPAGPLALPEHPTRHEVAALVLRAVQGVAAEFRAVAATLEGQQEPSQPPQVRMEDLARLQKLLAEFRTELVTIGTDVAKIERAIAAIRGSLAATQKQVADLAKREQAHRISGYMQFRWESDQAREPRSRFAVRRARVALGGPVAGNSYRIELAADDPPGQESNRVTLKDAYLARAIKGWRVQAGQMKIPFGIEVPQSDAKRLPPELSAVAERLFPGTRDRGIALFSPAGRLTGAVAVFNGSGSETSDTDNRKDVAARLAYDARCGDFGLSAYRGELVTPGGLLRKTRVGADALVPLGSATLQAEYIRGHGEFGPDGVESDASVQGWYFQGSVPLRGKPGGLLFARRDQYDPNGDLPGDDFFRTTLGWAWEPDPATRLTAAIELKKDRSIRGNQDAFTVQWQVIY